MGNTNLIQLGNGKQHKITKIIFHSLSQSTTFSSGWKKLVLKFWGQSSSIYWNPNNTLHSILFCKTRWINMLFMNLFFSLIIRGVHGEVQCNFRPFLAPHLIFMVTCVVWCGLEFSQNHNCTTPHFCSYMCSVVYKLRFEVSIFFEFWAFPAQPKTNFSLYFGPSFKLLS